MDRVPSFIFKPVAEIVATLLASPFNWCLPSREYPQQWKVASVTPNVSFQRKVII